MALSISLNTVATHVRNILAKTGCANRTEAAAYAMRHGPRPPRTAGAAPLTINGETAMPADATARSVVPTIYRLVSQGRIAPVPGTLTFGGAIRCHTHEHILSDELLHDSPNAAGYDRENRFFQEDFADLRDAGYLTMPVPKELGGRGLTLAEVCREQRRLAYYAPATALGINMHLYWVGLAADLWRQGDRSLEWMLKEAMAGEVFNAGHSERGNDLPVLLSTSKAERVDGGFRITGHKMFGSLAPVWTRYGLHATWAMPKAGPRSCTPFCRAAPTAGASVETWDTMGMRATRSDDVMLEGAFVPDKYVARIVPAGGADAFVSRCSPGR